MGSLRAEQARQYAAGLARRYPPITSVSLHIGNGEHGHHRPVEAGREGSGEPDEQGDCRAGRGRQVYNTCWCATTGKSNIRKGELYLPVGQLGEHTKESFGSGAVREAVDLDSEEGGELWLLIDKAAHTLHAHLGVQHGDTLYRPQNKSLIE